MVNLVSFKKFGLLAMSLFLSLSAAPLLAAPGNANVYVNSSKALEVSSSSGAKIEYSQVSGQSLLKLPLTDFLMCNEFADFGDLTATEIRVQAQHGGWQFTPGDPRVSFPDFHSSFTRVDSFDYAGGLLGILACSTDDSSVVNDPDSTVFYCGGPVLQCYTANADGTNAVDTRKIFANGFDRYTDAGNSWVDIQVDQVPSAAGGMFKFTVEYHAPTQGNQLLAAAGGASYDKTAYVLQLGVDSDVLDINTNSCMSSVSRAGMVSGDGSFVFQCPYTGSQYDISKPVVAAALFVGPDAPSPNASRETDFGDNVAFGYPVADALAVQIDQTTPDVPVGDTIDQGAWVDYQLSLQVQGGPLPSDLILQVPGTNNSDLGSFGVLSGSPQVVPAYLGNGLTFTLSAGAGNGTYTVNYQAQVAAAATGTVANNVAIVAGGTANNASCGACSWSREITEPSIEVSLAAKDPPFGNEVAAGDWIKYAVTVVIDHASLRSDLGLKGELGADLDWVGSINNAGFKVTSPDVSAPDSWFQSSGLGDFGFMAGAPVGTYWVVYYAKVKAIASGNGMSSTLSALTNGGDSDGVSVCGNASPSATCSGSHTLTAATASLKMVADPPPKDGQGLDVPVQTNDKISYKITVTVTGSKTTSSSSFNATLMTGGQYAAIDTTQSSWPSSSGSSCLLQAGDYALNCTLGAGVIPGDYTVVVDATVTASSGSVQNEITGSINCTSGCTITHQISN